MSDAERVLREDAEDLANRIVYEVVEHEPLAVAMDLGRGAEWTGKRDKIAALILDAALRAPQQETSGDVRECAKAIFDEVFSKTGREWASHDGETLREQIERGICIALSRHMPTQPCVDARALWAALCAQVFEPEELTPEGCPPRLFDDADIQAERIIRSHVSDAKPRHGITSKTEWDKAVEEGRCCCDQDKDYHGAHSWWCPRIVHNKIKAVRGDVRDLLERCSTYVMCANKSGERDLLLQQIDTALARQPAQPCVDVEALAKQIGLHNDPDEFNSQNEIDAEIAALIRSHVTDAATVRAERDKEWADALGMTEYTTEEGRTPESGKRWLDYCVSEVSDADK